MASDDQNQQHQRTLRAIILCVMVVFVYTQVFLKPKQKTGPQQTVPVSTVTQGPVVNPVSPSTPLAAVSASPVEITNPAAKLTRPSLEQLKSATLTKVNTGVAEVTITHLGARILNYVLRDYRLNLGEEALLDLIDNPNGTSMPLGVFAGNTNDEATPYTLVEVNGAAPTNSGAPFVLAEGAKVDLKFAGKLPDGTDITKTVILTHGSSLFDVSVALSKPVASGEPVWLEWSHYFAPTDENPRLRLTHLTYLDGFDKIRHVPLTELTQTPRDFGTSKWSSVGDLYFMATLIPARVEGHNTILGREGDVLFARAGGTPSGGSFTLYVGPKDYKTLKYLPHDLERSIDLGWFTFLAYPLLWMIHYLYQVLGNYGLAIITLTLIIKSLLLPLSKASFASMKRMQDVQPEINALRERIKDPTQLNQEIFALYKRKGVNPMGGCLPMLIQIPVFLGLYQALLNSIELRHAPFALWIQDLSSPERLMIFGIPVPVMVLLMAASMMVQSWTTPQPADPAQRKAMMIMPFAFAIMFIIFPMPAGLVLYWLVNNLISITQQVFLRREGSASAYKATFLAALAIFACGYAITLI